MVRTENMHFAHTVHANECEITYSKWNPPYLHSASLQGQISTLLVRLSLISLCEGKPLREYVSGAGSPMLLRLESQVSRGFKSNFLFWHRVSAMSAMKTKLAWWQRRPKACWQSNAIAHQAWDKRIHIADQSPALTMSSAIYKCHKKCLEWTYLQSGTWHTQ